MTLRRLAIGMGMAFTLGLSPLVAAGPEEGGPGGGGPSGSRAKGKRLFFTTAACSGCHMIGNRGGRLGPDLTHVGSSREEAWIAAKIYNPRLGNPQTIMPSAEELGLTDANVADLAAYLASRQ
jgi:mono/diheme cytochrome c family protein